MAEEPFELESALEASREIRAALATNRTLDALALYSERSSDLSARSLWEWRLVDALYRDRPALEPVSWPDDVLNRSSGAALAFVVAQLSGEDLALPAGLARLTPIPRSRKQALAAAWLWRPACLCLREPDFRSRFVDWATDSPEAVGACLLAAAEVGDQELIARLGPLWLARGVFHSGAPEQIERASGMRDLKTLASSALRTVIGTFLTDTQGLLHLLAAAYSLRSFSTVLALSKIVLQRAELASGQKERALVLLLGALADLDRFEEVATAYRERWMPLGIPFPQPDGILYSFQRQGENELERHLLESLDPREETSSWVRLRRDFLLGGAPGRSALEAWEDLYREHGKDERVLVGATEAVLGSAPSLREQWRERLALLDRWQGLAKLEPYRLLAGSYLVLLQPTNDDRIEAFEKFLDRPPLAQAPVRRAARAFVAALRQTRRWNRLRDLSRSWPDLFALACPFKERELAQLLGRLVDLPTDESGFRLWCAHWERLLSLPLSGREVTEVLDHFVQQRRELERVDPESREDDLLRDVELQILRRAKAEAELRLARTGDAQTRESLRPRLRTARLEATLRILEELDPLGDDHA